RRRARVVHLYGRVDRMARRRRRRFRLLERRRRREITIDVVEVEVEIRLARWRGWRVTALEPGGILRRPAHRQGLSGRGRDRDERPVVTQVEQRQVTGRVVRGRSREREFVAAVAAPLTGLEAQVAALWTFHGGSSHGRKQRVLDFT